MHLAYLLVLAVSMAALREESKKHKEIIGSKQNLALATSEELVEQEPVKEADNERKIRSPGYKKCKPKNKKGQIMCYTEKGFGPKEYLEAYGKK